MITWLQFIEKVKADRKEAQLKKKNKCHIKDWDCYFSCPISTLYININILWQPKFSDLYSPLCNQEKDENSWLEIKIAIVNFSTKWVD